MYMTELLEDGPMTLGKITKAMEVTSAYWLKLIPVVRDIAFHYQDIMNDGKLTAEDIRDGKDNVRRLRKVLDEGGK